MQVRYGGDRRDSFSGQSRSSRFAERSGSAKSGFDFSQLVINSRRQPFTTWRTGYCIRLSITGGHLQGVISTSLNVTVGNVSALAGLGGDSRSIQFSAPIQPGNSGGPLTDLAGNLVGVVTSKLSPLWAAKNFGDLPQNVNFALRSSIVRDFLESQGVEYHTSKLDAAIPVPDLAKRLTSAVFALQCLGEVRSDISSQGDHARSGTSGLPASLRTEGVYQAPGSKAGTFAYLRFYQDGTVVQATSSGTAHEVAKWLAKGHQYSGVGQVTSEGKTIAFLSTSQSGNVEFQGTVQADGLGLELTTHSHINNFRGRYHYQFVPVDFLATH